MFTKLIDQISLQTGFTRNYTIASLRSMQVRWILMNERSRLAMAETLAGKEGAAFVIALMNILINS
jgi:hypothetical protein